MTQAKALPQVRLRFAKRGELRLVSHHDLLRCLERMVRRARIPLATSQGFNPRPKITFALALGLGIEALREVVDLELTEPLDPQEVLRRLSAAAPPGFSWLEARSLSPGESPPRPRTVSYLLEIPADRRAGAAAALATFLESSSWPFERRRPDRTVSLDLRPFLTEASLTELGQLAFRLRITPEATARGEEIVEALGLSDLLEGGGVLVRVDVELSPPPERKGTEGPRKASEPNPAPPGDQNENETELPDPIPATPPRLLGPGQAVLDPAGALDELPPGIPDMLGRPDRI